MKCAFCLILLKVQSKCYWDLLLLPEENNFQKHSFVPCLFNDIGSFHRLHILKLFLVDDSCIQTWHVLPSRGHWVLLAVFLHVDPKLKDCAGSGTEHLGGREGRPQMIPALHGDFATFDKATVVGFKHPRCPDLSKSGLFVKLGTLLCTVTLKIWLN